MRGNDSSTVAQRELAYSRREHEKPKSRFTPGDLLLSPATDHGLAGRVVSTDTTRLERDFDAESRRPRLDAEHQL